ncbi:MAG: LuxR C-terminal-related transcriptional regulator [Flavobacteriaceae bacterium]
MYKNTMRTFSLLFIFLGSLPVLGQYHFSGHVLEQNVGKAVYLSLVEDYRKSSRVYWDQIIRKSIVDSLGNFNFTGNNIMVSNRTYRIHMDDCSDNASSPHFVGECDESQSVLFIANARDTIQFPTSFGDEVLCTIISTNEKSAVFLEIDALKEEMIFDFMDFRSETNKKINSEQWFVSLQEFGNKLGEPLGELYIYDFLSDKRNETYDFYLRDVLSNTYYTNLLNRLETTYPNTNFTYQYLAEIETDKILASYSNPKTRDWKRWGVFLLILISFGLNGYFFIFKRLKKNSSKKVLLQKLTEQEQKIVRLILQEKSNKEIASELFVSHSTIKTHINNLYKKLNVSSRLAIKEMFKK